MLANCLSGGKRTLISLWQEVVLQLGASLQEIRPLPSHRNWDKGVLSPLVFTFRKDSSQVPEKDSGQKADKGLSNLRNDSMYISRRWERTCTFSKENTVDL